jgi:predicted PolB exonuclease-like 3'-5' exonuclease
MLASLIMPEQSVIVWDLETVPDLEAAARMLDMGGAPEADVRQALGSGFPKHPLHKIVCIGASIASRQLEGWRVDSLGAPHIGERTEGELITAFISAKWVFLKWTSPFASGFRPYLSTMP